MGIYNRDYYRQSRQFQGGGGGLGEWSPAVKFLLLANIAVFILQILVVREVPSSSLERLRQLRPDIDKLLTQADEEGEDRLEFLKKRSPKLYKNYFEEDIDPSFEPPERVSLIQEWLELDTKKVTRSGQVWRLLTYAFCHDRYGIFHIFFNMLCFYWFGITLELMYGTREFVLFYLTAAVVSGVTYLGLNVYTGSTAPCIGASGAVIAVMMLYTMHYPGETINIFWFLPVQMRWIMIFYLIYDLHPVLLAISGERNSTGVAHAAHLGGLAFGFFYAKYEWRLESLASRVGWLRWRARPRLRLRFAPESDPGPEPDMDLTRVDQVLQKIGQSGQASLTDEELALLRKASERLKKRPNR
jgi:membrane associated rhomboid family serine protease